MPREMFLYLASNVKANEVSYAFDFVCVVGLY